MSNFSIKCLRTDSELCFETKSKDQYQITLRGKSFNLLKTVWEYSEGIHLVNLLHELGNRTKPWQDPIVWNSISPDFKLEFRCDRQGHVSIMVKISRDSPLENWDFQTVINTELGQLLVFSKNAAKFFQTVLESPESAE